MNTIRDFQQETINILQTQGIISDLATLIADYAVAKPNLEVLNILASKFYSFQDNKLLITTKEQFRKQYDVFLWRRVFQMENPKVQFEKLLDKLFTSINYLDDIFYDSPVLYLEAPTSINIGAPMRLILIGARDKKYITYRDILRNSWPFSYFLLDTQYTERKISIDGIFTLTISNKVKKQ